MRRNYNTKSRQSTWTTDSSPISRQPKLVSNALNIIIDTSRINKFTLLVCIIVSGCVPLQQQHAATEESETDGYVAPLMVDADTFASAIVGRVYDPMTADDKHLPSTNSSIYQGTFNGKAAYLQNCKCIDEPKIMADKLVLVHSYGGGESHRTHTKLLWNGKYYQNAKGEHIVDVILYTDRIDLRRALIMEKQIFNVVDLKLQEQRFIWINLVGYEDLIRYNY